MEDIEISNGLVVHGRGPDQVRHPTDIRCARCPSVEALATPAEPLVKVSFSRVDPAAGQTEQQEVAGTPDVVAAWLRAMADRLAPPPRPAKPCRCASQGEPTVLGRPRHTS